MDFYQRNLPHWQPSDAEYFITFRLAGSLPKEAVERIKKLQKQLADQSPEEIQNTIHYKRKINRRIFQKYESLLEKNSSGSNWLNQDKVARIVCNAIEYRHGNQYDLYAYCIMPNHVHLVFKLLQSKNHGHPVTKILQSLKRFTAREANKILQRSGQFWQHESFDRVIRTKEELERTIKYVLNNPVKAGLSNKWDDWAYNFCKPEFISDIL